MPRDNSTDPEEIATAIVIGIIIAILLAGLALLSAGMK